MLVRVSSPYFEAAFVLRDNVVVEAAPIIKYMKGKNREWVRNYVKKKEWKAVIINKEVE